MSGRLEKDKAVRFISKLVQLTTDKKLEWQAISGDDDRQIEFQTEIEDRKIRLYKYSREVPNPAYDAYINPFSSSSILYGIRGEPSKTILLAGTVLEFLDSYSSRPIYKIENVAGLSDLYEVVSYTAAKVDELVDAVLSKE